MDNQENNQNEDKQNETIKTNIVLPHKKLYRSPTNSFLFGIAGGISEYLNVSAVFIRILFMLTALLEGWGIIVYILCVFLIPEHPSLKEKGKSNRINSPKFLGFVFIIIGFYNWIPPFGIFKYIDAFNYIDSILSAVIILALGLFVLIKGKDERSITSKEKPVKLYRSTKGRRLLGICKGLAVYLETDVNIIRILWILLSFMTSGVAVLFYFVIGFFIPREEIEVTAND